MTCKNGHSIFNRKCSSCKELQSEWYKKANKEDVYEDIENENGDLIDHKSIFDLYQRKHFQTTEVLKANIQYHTWAERMLEAGKFKSKKDKLIWKYHIKGLSQYEIAPKVNFAQSWVSRKIRKITKYLKNQEH